MKELTPRAAQLLHHICEYVIRTGEPISSRTLQRHFSLEISPATIRNEMADLEADGFLTQPHISSGRVPTEDGYRFYVETLHKFQVLNELEGRLIQRLCDLKDNEELVYHKAIEILSNLTHCPSFSVTLSTQERLLRDLKLVKVDASRLMAIFIDNHGEISNQLIDCGFELDTRELDYISRCLAGHWAGTPFQRVSRKSLTEMRKLNERYERLLKEIISNLNTRGGEKEKDFVLDGTIHFLDIPEFKDFQRLKEIMFLLNSKEKILGLFQDSLEADSRAVGSLIDEDDLRIKVRIGRDLHEPGLEQMCFLSSVVDMNMASRKTFVGLLGPMRLDYRSAIASLHAVSRRLAKILFRP